MIIYCATNIVNGKKYIGQTIHSLEKRKNQHLKSANANKENCRLFWRAIRKYGYKSFKWEILFKTSSKKELDLMESFYIDKYNTTNPQNGYNLKGGGYEPFLTEEVKQRISDSQKGELNHMFGKKGKLNPSSIQVYNVTDDVYYDSATECHEKTGLSISKICAVCRGERATTGNKVFRYVIDGEIKNVSPKTKRKSRSVKNIETGKIYNSCVEACVDVYGDKKFIDRVYNSLRRNTGIWVYV